MFRNLIVAHMMLLVMTLPGASHLIACTRTADMPPHVPAILEQSLSQEKYLQRAAAWQTYLDEHPDSGIAYVELEQSLRYARKIASEEQLSMLRQAYATAPDCHLVLDRLAHLEFENSYWGDRSALPRARDLAERAIEVAPDWWRPHLMLWTLSIVAGDGAAAAQQMALCLDKGAFSSPLLDYAYNMLSTAAPYAIIFTNGDDDTFPLLALQARYGVRTDVRIVNLSMSTIPEYVTLALQEREGHASPFTESELKALHTNMKRGALFGRVVFQEMAQRLAEGDWDEPLYASTILPNIHELSPNQLKLQGLLYRIQSEMSMDGEGLPTDVARTDSLLEHVYRMESTMDYGFSWGEHPITTQYMRSYIGCYHRMLTVYAEAGDLENSRRMLRNILPMLEFHEVLRYWNGGDRAEMLLSYWSDLDPANPEVDRWRRRLKI